MNQNNSRHSVNRSNINSNVRTNVKKVPNKKSRKKNNRKKVAIVILMIIVILIGIIVGFIYNKISKVNFVELNKENLGIGNSTGYRNIALLGVDSRNMNNTKGSRSDAIIIVSINQKTKNVNLISVYRDSYLDVQGHGLTKVTHAHAYGGPELAINTLNRNLDLDISEFVTVNFEIVADIVDLVGGVEVNIQKSEINEMNKYIKDTSKNVGRSAKPITSSGKQKLDGIQAVTYGRIRKVGNGDYRRTERMRTVIKAVFDKAKTMNVSTLNDIANKILPEVQTNIGLSEVISLIPSITSVNVSDSIGWPYEVRSYNSGASYVAPVTLEANVVKLHREVFKQENYEASDIVKEISNNIIKKTGYSKTSIKLDENNTIND